MREHMDENSRFLESQLAGLEALTKEKGEWDGRVPAVQPKADNIWMFKFLLFEEIRGWLKLNGYPSSHYDNPTNQPKSESSDQGP